MMFPDRHSGGNASVVAADLLNMGSPSSGCEQVAHISVQHALRHSALDIPLYQQADMKEIGRSIDLG
jgi:hypothetical protein